jgi:hypothetical protein
MWSSTKNNKKHLHSSSHEDSSVSPKFTEADLEDPELLAELHGLIQLESSTSPTMTVKQPTYKGAHQTVTKEQVTINKEETNIELDEEVVQMLSNLPLQNEDVHVELTDKDMEDPELLASFILFLQKKIF